MSNFSQSCIHRLHVLIQSDHVILPFNVDFFPQIPFLSCSVFPQIAFLNACQKFQKMHSAFAGFSKNL